VTHEAQQRLTHPRARTVFAGVFVATLLTQLAWILALPAFHGIDEFDHVYKAAAVAHGQVLPAPQAAKHGRGGVVVVPGDVVAAAGDVCASFLYTGHDNCRPIAHEPGGMVQVASAASRYNPVYYAVVGTLALPFHGAAYDYAMRVISAVACALLMAWGAVVTARWARDHWPLAAYLLASTPVVLYSTSVAAPNGLEYAAALLLWASGIALARDVAPRALLPFTVAASVMLAMHTTGGLWLLIATGVVLLLAPVQHWRQLFSDHRARCLAAAATLSVVGAACVAWVILARTNLPESGGGPGHAPPLGVLLTQNALWPLQAIAAIPMRDQPAPPFVYAALLIPLVALLVAGWRAASRRTRVAGTLLVAASVVVPSVLTWLTYAQMGTAWQGRYCLPLYVGVPLIAAHALTGTRPMRFPYRVVLLGLLALGSAVAVAHVARDVVVVRPGTSAAEALPLGWLLVAVLAGFAALALAPVLVGSAGRRVPDSRPLAAQPTSVELPAAAVS
jgi:hypothetical protein